MICENFRLKKNEIKDYWTHVLKNDTWSGDMDEMVDHWLDSFEKFHKKYIIMPSLSLNLLLIEESLFVTVWSPPGFINPENETRCYLNSMFQLLYFNVLFRELVFKIDCYTMLNGLKKESQDFVHHLKNIMIIKELQVWGGQDYHVPPSVCLLERVFSLFSFMLALGIEFVRHSLITPRFH